MKLHRCQSVSSSNTYSEPHPLGLFIFPPFRFPFLFFQLNRSMDGVNVYEGLNSLERSCLANFSHVSILALSISLARVALVSKRVR